MNIIKFFLNVQKAIFFISCVSIAVVLAFINRDSPVYMTVSAAIAIVIIFIFFRFSTLTKKVKIISTCFMCVFTVIIFFSLSMSNYPSFTVMNAVHDRFPGIATWDVRKDNSGKNYEGRYTGICIYYNMDREKFEYDGISKDNVKDISVIAFYSHAEPKKIGVYYDEKTGKKYTDAFVTDINVALVDAETRVCFAEKTFTTQTPSTIKDPGQARTMVGYDSGSVRLFISKFFQK